MNKLEYDDMTEATFELDDVHEVLQGSINNVDFPVLKSNANVSQKKLLADKQQKSVIIERDSELIGLIGLKLEDMGELASSGDNVTFLDPMRVI